MRAPRSRYASIVFLPHRFMPGTPLILLTFLRLVLETLEPLPGDRKCFRLINGVLVERTVQDVVPALQTNADGLKKVLDDLVKQYKSKQDELEKWKVLVTAKPVSQSLPFIHYLTREIEKEQRADRLSTVHRGP